MSTIVVVRKNDEIVIGADSLTKYGSTKLHASYSKDSTKIIKVGDSYIATCGNAVSKLILKKYFNNLEKKPQLTSVENIFDTFCELHKALKDDFYINPNESEEDEYESSQMLCLIANKSGIFGIDQFRFVEEYTEYSAYGTGYKFALGAMKVAYDQNLSASEVARIGLEVAANYDDCTGLPLQIIKMK